MKVVSTLVAVASADHPSFHEWAANYGLTLNGPSEEMQSNYAKTLQRVAEYEAEPGQTATFAMNQFSAMSEDEFARTILTYHGSALAGSDMPMLDIVQGESHEGDVNWDVTPVKDQGSCGSCWAFGTIGGIEAKHKQATGQTVQLAEQQLLDCDHSCDGVGTACDTNCNCDCQGGQANWAYGSYLENTPIYTMSSYPYEGRKGSCHQGTDSGVRISGFTSVGSLMGASNAMTDASLAAAVNQGVVVVAVGAAGKFASYSGGVLTGVTTSCSLNHQVMVTGYGSNYWKVKNSWGPSWGEKGFIRFERATGGCGPFGLFMVAGVVPTLSSSSSIEV